MANLQIRADHETTIRATIIRADGRREDLGTVYGGSLLQKVASFLRIKLANLKHGYYRTH